MRFFGNMIGSFVIIALIFFFMWLVAPAIPFGAESEPSSGQGLLPRQRILIGAGILLMTVLVAFKTPAIRFNIWFIRIFLFYFIVAVPLIAIQFSAQMQRDGEWPPVFVTLLGLWVFILGGITYRHRLLEALWLKPKETVQDEGEGR